ncbi:MAG: S1C family serine protease, partial [bacterium]
IPGNLVKAQQTGVEFNRENFPPVKVAENATDCLVTIESISLPYAGYSVLNIYQRTIVEGGGTGLIVGSDGYILTLPEFVRDVKYLNVKHKGKEYKATVEVIDDYYDLALLKVDAKLPAVKWGDSDKVERGIPVVVMGAPSGLDRTMTYGFVTNVRDFRIMGPRGIDGMLILNGFVVDAALHAGMYPGPVYNSDGLAIAIAARKAERSYRPPEDIGYVIPSNLIKKIVDQMIKHGKVCHPWLGVFLYYEYDRALALYMGIPVNEVDPETGQEYDVVGVLVDAVAPNSPAALVGITRGDLILRADGILLRTIKDLETIILRKECGDRCELTIMRGGELNYVTVEIGDKQKELEEEYGNIYYMSGKGVSI